MFLKIIFIFGNIFKLNNICIFNSVEPGKSNSINFISSFEYSLHPRDPSACQAKKQWKQTGEAMVQKVWLMYTQTLRWCCHDCMSATDPNIWNGMEWNRLAGIKTTWPKTNTFTFYGHCKLNFHKSDPDHRHRMLNTFLVIMVIMVILVIVVIIVQLGNPCLPKCKSNPNKVRKPLRC